MTDIDKLLNEMTRESTELDPTAYMTLAAYMMNACMHDAEQTADELEELSKESRELRNSIFDMFGYSESDFSPDIEVVEPCKTPKKNLSEKGPRQ